MAMIFERWLENVDGVSWHTLVSVLKTIGYHKVASCLCEYLHNQDALAVGDQQQEEDQQQQEQQQQQREEGDEGVTEGLSNHQRPFSLHISLTSGGTSVSGETQPLLSTCSIENYYSINEVLDQANEQQYKGLKGRVRSRHQQFINTLLIDGQLLAALHERELLSELQRQELHARIDRNDAPMRISNYFVGSVVFQWPSSVFDRNLGELSKALAKHSDAGNKHLGQMFDQILTSPSPD